MRLVSDRIIVREFLETDEAEAYKYLSDPDVMQYIEPIYTLSKEKEFIKTYAMEKKLVFAVEERISSKLIGRKHRYDTDK